MMTNPFPTAAAFRGLTIYDRRREVLEEMVEHYSAYPVARRAATPTNGCEYRIGAGELERRCAVGRLMPEDAAEEATRRSHGVAKEDTGRYPDPDAQPVVTADYIWPLVPRHIQDLGREFLRELQLLHDIEAYWDCDDLSSRGAAQVETMIRTYCTPPTSTP